MGHMREGFLLDIDFEAHNAEVREVWEAYRKGSPIRVPVVLGLNVRYWLQDPRLNIEGVTWRDYIMNPKTMLEVQLRFQHWARHNLVQDWEMGLPEGWSVHVDFQNFYDPAWLGAPVAFPEGEVPYAEPILAGDRKNLLFDRGIPDPFDDTKFGGWMRRNWDYYEFFKRKVEEGLEFKGRPLKTASPCGVGIDGPFTCAYKLRGAQNLLLDMFDDPDYVHSLMDFITTALIERIKAYRKALGMPEEGDSWGFADDAIELLSVEQYKEFVLPYHKRLIRAFGKKGPNSIHLCGDAQRHFKVIKEELKVLSFDTGFPFDFAKAREELGPEVEILGGVHISLLKDGTPKEIEREVVRIFNTGVLEGGRFVLREANNLAPMTPPENVKAMFDAARKWGRYKWA